MEARGGQHIKETAVVRMVFLLSRNEIFDLHQGASLGFVTTFSRFFPFRKRARAMVSTFTCTGWDKKV